MKKNYIYFVAPLVGLIIFGAVYWNFSKGYNKREAKRVADEKQKKEDKLRQQAKDNEKAIREAVASPGTPQSRARRQGGQGQGGQGRSRHRRRGPRQGRPRPGQTRQAGRAPREGRAGEKDAIAKLQSDKQKLIDEQAFQKVYVKQAEDNVRNLTQVLDRIAAADAARAAADARPPRRQEELLTPTPSLP